MEESYIIETKNLTKYYGDFLAVDNVSIGIQRGKITTIIGENGAGKTTLMNMIYGLIQPSHGEILINGVSTHLRNPKDAIDNKIGMVHQHFKLAPSLTIYENIFLGTEQLVKFGKFIKTPLIDNKEEIKKVNELLTTYSFVLDPNARVKDISIGLQQRVEILKMLFRDVDTLILDEPTAVLTPQEVEELIIILKKLKDNGKTIIVITHKLKEVMKLSSRCIILRRGKLIGVYNPMELTEEELAELMVGRAVTLRVNKAKHSFCGIDALYQVSNLCAKGFIGEEEVLHDISLSIRPGEILGVAGVEGNGQSELMMLVSGLLESQKGTIYLDKVDITNSYPDRLRKNGVAMIPEDRFALGLCRGTAISRNLIAGYHFSPPNCKSGLMNYRKIKERSQTLIEQFDIRASGDIDVGSLSGGNAQKVIVAREFSSPLKVLFVSRPTRGVDVGSIEFIHKRILELRESGIAILLISSELSEVLDLSDNIIVFFRGKIVGYFDASETTQEELGLYMMGLRSQDQTMEMNND